MATPATWRGVVKRYRNAPEEVQVYFSHLPELAEDFPWGVCLAWMFARVELAWNMTIYCGVVKLHRAESSLARKAVDGQYMTRGDFRTFFQTIYGKPVDKKIHSLIEEALATRDLLMHGKKVSEVDKRAAVVGVLAYAEQFNDFVYGLGGPRPFGSLSGFKGRAEPLDKSTTRWLLKGVGLTLS